MTTKRELGKLLAQSNQPSSDSVRQSYLEGYMNDESCSQEKNQIFKNISINKEGEALEGDPTSIELLRDLHDDFCFSCFEDGNLKQCGLCFRAYHDSCMIFYPIPSQLAQACKYCKMKLKEECIRCLGQIILDEEKEKYIDSIIVSNRIPDIQNTQKKYKLTCTVCYRDAHSDCCNFNIQLWKTKNYFFQGQSNYVCVECITKIKTIKVLNTKKVTTKQGEKVYYFVNASLESPIHAFWISDQDVIRRKKKGTIKVIQSSNECTGFDGSIDRIIDFRSPLKHRELAFQNQVAQLATKVKNGIQPSSYGSFENYRFLVKWNNHDCYVWEDECVVIRYLFKLKRFVAKIIFEGSIIQNQPQSIQKIQAQLFTPLEVEEQSKVVAEKYKPEKPQTQTLYITFGSIPIYESSCQTSEQYKATHLKHLLSILNEKRSVEIVQKSNSHSSIAIFAKCIQQILRRNSVNSKICIVITEKEDVQRWRAQLQINYPLLEILVFDKEEGIELLKKKQFLFKNLFYPQFQVLITSHENYLKHENFIVTKIKGVRNILSEPKNDSPITEMIILDLFKKDFLDFSHAKFPDFQKFIVLKEGRNSWIEAQIKSNFQNYFVFKFGLDNPQLRECISSIEQHEKHKQLFSRRIFNTSNQYCKSVEWTEAQRAYFHIYIMSFSFNQFEGPDDCLVRLNSEYPEIFPSPITSDMKRQCAKYLKLFMSLVRDIHFTEIPRSIHTQQFLFHASRQKVFKRICQLTRMKTKVQEYRSKPGQFPFKIPLKLFIGKEIIHIKKWGGLQDFILCSLILRYGFGNWQKILSDKEYSGIVLQPYLKDTTFELYVLWILDRKKHERQLQLKKILEDRGIKCLQVMN